MSKQLKLTQSAIISVFASTATIQVHADFLEDSKTSLNLRNFILIDLLNKNGNHLLAAGHKERI